jgi:hypothetical protein
MRHHGVPTRLLDWTESLAVAIYFALSGSVNKPCIWLLNPYKLNNKSLNELWVLNLELEDKLHYDKAFIRNETNWPYELPVAIDSLWRNLRLNAQRGFFTLHGTNPRPLNKQAPTRVKRVMIPQEAIDDCRQFLKESGVNEFSLFPDLDGLARWLSSLFGFT